MTFACETPPTGTRAALTGQITGLVPALETERLDLRAPRCEDFPAYADICCGERSAGIGGPMSREDAWWDFTALASNWFLHGHGGWAADLKSGGDLAGFVLLCLEPGDLEPELGFLCVAEHEGKGLMYEAALAARAFAFGPLEMPTLVSYVFPENTRSLALCERLGAVKDGEVVYPGDKTPSWVLRHPNPKRKV